MQRFALESIDSGKDDAIVDDETLLQVLADKLHAGAFPTPGEICQRAKELDAATFDRWTPRSVSNRLKAYGIVARKVDRRREFRDTTLADLARIQRHYRIDLEIRTPTGPVSSSLASRCVPETPVSAPQSTVPGRNGTNRDARRGHMPGVSPIRYDAVASLESLFQPTAGTDEDASLAQEPDIVQAGLPPGWHLLWDERAAILEYEGKMWDNSSSTGPPASPGSLLTKR